MTYCNCINEKVGNMAERISDGCAQDENIEPANLQFWVVCSGQELVDNVMTPLNVVEGKSKLSSIMTPLGNSMVGVADVADTVAVNRIIDEAYASGAIDKYDICFAWSTVDSRNMVELYALWKESNGSAALEGDIVERARASCDLYGKPYIAVELKEDAARKFTDFTECNVGKYVAIVINGVVYSAPCVSGRIDGGKLEITGMFSEDEAKELAKALNSSVK